MSDDLIRIIDNRASIFATFSKTKSNKGRKTYNEWKNGWKKIKNGAGSIIDSLICKRCHYIVIESLHEVTDKKTLCEIF